MPSLTLGSLVPADTGALTVEELGDAVFGPEANVAATSFESLELDTVQSLVSVALLRGERSQDLDSIDDLAALIAAGGSLYLEAHASERALVDFVLVAPVIVVEASWPQLTHLGSLALSSSGATLGVAVAAGLTPISFLASDLGMVWITIGGHVRQRMRYRQLQAELDELARRRDLDRLTADEHAAARKGALDDWLRLEP